MKKIAVFVAIVGTLYGVAGSLASASSQDAVASAHQVRAAAIEAATK